MKNHIKLSFALTTSILFTLSFQSFAEELMLLKDNRDKLVLPILSIEEKKQVISISRTIFDKFYVNLDHKKEFYKIDPVQEFNNIENNLDQLSEIDFQKKMIKNFASVKDYHVNYYLPYPYQCNGVYLPINFEKIGTQQILVSGIYQTDLDKMQITDKFSIGDELISYNGKLANDFLNSQKEWTSGSTKAADDILSVYRLSYISNYESIAPDEDYVDLTLKRSNGEIYSVKIPWLFESYQKCLDTKNSTDNNGSNGESFVDQIRIEHYKKFEKKNKRTQALNAQKMNIKMFGAGDISTEDPNINYKIFLEGDRKYGYIKLSSFEPKLSAENSLAIIRKILREKLNDTHALIMDVRGNYGGQINFAESLAAMLYPKKVNRIPFYVKANDYTASIFDEDNSWGQLIKNREHDDQIVGPNYLQNSSEARSVSQEYFSKVILVTNGECFSSCDIFASALKDVGGIKIYGRAASTFGGGANVWKLKDFSYGLKKLKLPFEMPRKMGLRATFRHSHRLSTNKLVEDAGVESDIVVPSTMNDVVANEDSILKRVILDLNNDQNLELSSKTILGSDLNFRYIHGHQNLDQWIYAINVDRVVGRTNINEAFDLEIKNQKDIVLNNSLFKKNIQLVELFGFKQEEVKARNAFWVEKLNDYVSIGTFDFSKDAYSFIYDSSAEGCGFKNLNDTWYIDSNYCLNTTMKLNMALDLKSNNAKKLTFKVKGKLEENFDYFHIQILLNGNVYEVRDYLTGDIDQEYSIDLNQFVGGKIDVQAIVSSDELGTESGVTISNFKIE